MRTAGVREANWLSPWGDAFRSVKRHGSGSSREHVLDLLCFLQESSDEKMQKMDLDDVTLEQVAAARSALRKAELAVKKGEHSWNWEWHQVALWLVYLGGAEVVAWIRGSAEAPSHGRSCEDFDESTGTGGRKGEPHGVFARSGFNSIGILFLTPKLIKIWIHR